jgi:protein mcrC
MGRNKYYSSTTQVRFDKYTIHSNNLYQIFTYVKNRQYQFGENKCIVSGMLLYAKINEQIQPDNLYQLHGNQISVPTLDLNLPFKEMEEQLDAIIFSHFKHTSKK